MPSTRPLAVVTGASSGIGQELARQLAQRGYDLVLTASKIGFADTAGAIEAQGGQVVDEIAADLATMEGVDQLASRLAGIGRPIEVLALNAGFGRGGSFLDAGTLENELQMIHVNVIATVVLAKKLLPPMVERGSGKVLITASIAAVTPTPLEAIYGATKSFLKSFSESLFFELKDKGVTVTALMPGPTETNFFHRAGMDDTKLGAASKDDPADVVRQGLDALFAGKDHVIAGSMKTKVQGGLMENILPESIKGSLHLKEAMPGSAK